jgi:hypothetical protein
MMMPYETIHTKRFIEASVTESNIYFAKYPTRTSET